MALTYEFLIERAEQASLEAAGAVLENVRERAHRSELAWRSMANQALEVQKGREAGLRLRNLALTVLAAQ